MVAISELKKVVVFRKGDKVRHIETREISFVEYVYIKNYKLVIVTSDGVNIPDYKLKNITWLENNLDNSSS